MATLATRLPGNSASLNNAIVVGQGREATCATTAPVAPMASLRACSLRVSSLKAANPFSQIRLIRQSHCHCPRHQATWRSVRAQSQQPESSSTRSTGPDVHVSNAELDLPESVAAKVATVGELDLSPLSPPADVEIIDTATAMKTVGFWVAAATAFGLGVGFVEGPTKASEFFAGYLLEQSLSVDNLFVFVLVFSYFKVPTAYQPRVLTYGIAGAVIFRAIMIGLGIAAIQAFEAVNLLFAAVLLFSSYKLLAEAEDEDDDLSNNSVVKFCQQLIPITDYYDSNKFYTTTAAGIQMATPLLLTLAVVELSDIVFAFDSIPAVFGVTRDPFIVFTSNIFAILGLRSLFTVISTSMADLHFLQPAIAIVLGFIGSKILAEFCGVHVPTEVSLGVVAALLAGGVFLSLRFPRTEGDDKEGL
ncbi:hypothetical protein CLOM_g6224 [Closterium sp. NIES-68]|nr:hypothetical protein CLOM_g6224 [Closterium sp. NIES-68]GJP77615.1 hypothetical protein CLOP_g7978 [Closterium sp. NIES-67]